MSTLLLVVPRGRAYCGRATLVGDGGSVVVGPFRVLATASARLARMKGNPACDPLHPFGHPPVGSYTVVGSLPPLYRHPRRPRRFGAVGGLLLEPTAGDALESMSFGRSVFVLHGGELDPLKRLRPTRGGIRLSDPDLLALVRAVNAVHLAGDGLASVEIVEVSEEDIKAVPPMDLRGARRRSRTGMASSIPPVGRAAFLAALGLGAGRAGSGTELDRRGFLLSALAMVGGLTLSACGSNSGPAPVTCEQVVEPDGTVVDSCDTAGYGVGGGTG